MGGSKTRARGQQYAQKGTAYAGGAAYPGGRGALFPGVNLIMTIPGTEQNITLDYNTNTKITITSMQHKV
jgi:hypothetical protein